MSAPISHFVVFGVIGIGLGCAHFTALRVNTRLYFEDGARKRAAALHLARMLLVALALVLIARFGAIALLAAFSGFVIARPLVVKGVLEP